MRTGGNYAGRACSECGIPLSDGFTVHDPELHDPLDCATCKERQGARLRRGTTHSPTGYAGEMVDNRTGRLVASGA